jgi:hypothetical protein
VLDQELGKYEENIEKSLEDKSISNLFLNRTLITQKIKIRINK